MLVADIHMFGKLRKDADVVMIYDLLSLSLKTLLLKPVCVAKGKIELCCAYVLRICLCLSIWEPQMR